MSANEEKQLGVMWEWDHERWLPLEEAVYWDYHVLPFGWSIIIDPRRAETKGKREGR
jgi:hypothetical protein